MALGCATRDERVDLGVLVAHAGDQAGRTAGQLAVPGQLGVERDQIFSSTRSYRCR